MLKMSANQLTNTGFLPFRQPYIVCKAPDLQRPANTLVAFVNVNVVPMDRERVLENQTVPTFIERLWPISLIAAAAFLILRRVLETKGSNLP